MRVEVIEGKCQGHARCASLAPEVFDLDENGYAIVLPGCSVLADDDVERLEDAKVAADNCPEEAIRLTP